MKNSTYYIFFNNLSNKLRIDIVLSLKAGEKSVGELVKDLGVEQSKISHALSSLRCCNIVSSKRDGKNIIYSLNKKTIIPMLKLIEAHAKNFCKGKCKECER